jgi:RNA polymerase sigma factor (TIGR02999 family)
MSKVTRILSAIEQGDPTAAGLLLPLVYDELRELAAQRLAHEKPGQTLQATALVHEAYLRLVEGNHARHWNSRGHFFAAAAEAMRRILVESARRKAHAPFVARAMATKKSVSKKATPSDPGTNEVDEFMRTLDHPLKPALEAVRSIILGVSPKISEGVKWNSPSFRVTEWFATINVRKDVVLVILHLGAKVKDNSTAGLTVDDPTGLIEWLAKERAAVTFTDANAVKAGRAAFEHILRQWIATVQ